MCTYMYIDIDIDMDIGIDTDADIDIDVDMDTDMDVEVHMGIWFDATSIPAILLPQLEHLLPCTGTVYFEYSPPLPLNSERAVFRFDYMI